MMQLRDTVGQLQRARRTQTDEGHVTAPFNDIGPGVLPPAVPPGINAQEAGTSTTSSIAESGDLERSIHGVVQEVSAGPRRMFSNALDKSRGISSQAGPQELVISPPAPGARPWPQSPGAMPAGTKVHSQAPAGAELPFPSTDQARGLPAPAGALHQRDKRIDVARRVPVARTVGRFLDNSMRPSLMNKPPPPQITQSGRQPLIAMHNPLHSHACTSPRYYACIAATSFRRQHKTLRMYCA